MEVGNQYLDRNVSSSFRSIEMKRSHRAWQPNQGYKFFHCIPLEHEEDDLMDYEVIFHATIKEKFRAGGLQGCYNASPVHEKA